MRIKEDGSPVELFYKLRSDIVARHTRTMLLVLAVVLMVAGCGDDGGGGY
ncbi:hypothetical protein BH23ACT11_BH23ACT11_31000 [soil metagenome]